MSFATKYRPQVFEDVLGQEYAVRKLSRCVIRGQSAHHTLYYGPFGTGKTTLQRIFARAVNCSYPSKTGSPCNACDNCIHQVGFFEYNVPEQGGAADDVLEWVRAKSAFPHDGKWTILFFDEAHALKRTATDALLKMMEDPQGPIILSFATTLPEALSPTLRSRLMPIEVRTLKISTAVMLLRKIADQNDIRYDLEALVLLAGIKRGHPRDLLVALELLSDLNERITIELIKHVFDFDHVDKVVSLFLAIAADDVASQINALDTWREEELFKVNWIETFLTSIYYQTICHQNIKIDPVIYATNAGCAEVTRRLCDRLALKDPSELEPYICRWMAFWRETARQTDEVSLRLSLALFQGVVRQDLLARKRFSGVQYWRGSGTLHPSTVLNQPPATKRIETPETKHGVAETLQFPRADHVREIINRASAFIQIHEQMFNAGFIIYPSPSLRAVDREAVQTIRDFISSLERHFQSLDADGSFAAISLLENDGGVLGRVVAHIPNLLTNDPAAVGRVTDFVDRFSTENSPPEQHDVQVRLAGCDSRGALQFHWDQVLELCSGLGDQVRGRDVGWPEDRPLLKLLKISKSDWRAVGPLRYQLVAFWGELSPAALDQACELKMALLSAFDEGYPTYIRTGWELDLFFDREKVLKERRQRISEITEIFLDDPTQQEDEIKKLQDSWPMYPIRRPWR